MIVSEWRKGKKERLKKKNSSLAFILVPLMGCTRGYPQTMKCLCGFAQEICHFSYGTIINMNSPFSK